MTIEKRKEGRKEEKKEGKKERKQAKKKREEEIDSENNIIKYEKEITTELFIGSDKEDNDDLPACRSI